jgi:DHA1 family tetracycline resistance protein-like MFS transporter
MVVPVLPKLISDFVGGNTARAAQIFGLFGTVWALMQFLFSPIQGALSDSYGRRPVILLSNFGLGLDYLVMAVAPGVGWLFVGRVISGITAASFTIATAYIADVAPAEKRARGFGLLSAAFGLGFVLGPALGGVLGQVNPRLPFWVAGGLSLLNGGYGFFILPESLPTMVRQKFSWRRASPLSSIGLLRSHAELLGLAVATFLGNIAHEALPTIFVLYAMYRYGWNERMVGLSIAGIGLVSAIVGAGAVGPVVTRIGERRTMLVGLAFGVAGFLVYAFAPTGPWFALGIPLAGIWGLSGPPTQGLMTRRVGPFEQGQLQGALSCVRGVAFMIGPILFTTIFASSIGRYRTWNLPGAAFAVAAILIAVATVVAARVTRSDESAAPAIIEEASSGAP